MHMLDDDLYYETKNIVLKKTKRSPILIEFSEWFMDTYAVKVSNIDFRKLNDNERNIHRFRVIIKDSYEIDKISENHIQLRKEVQTQTAIKFQELALKHKVANEEQLGNFFIILDNFFWEVKSEARHKCWDEVKLTLTKKFPVIWEVHLPTVFYYLDTDIETNENNGTMDSINNDYYEIMKKYDDLNYFTKKNISLCFDSKENLDNNYQGNLLYYSRDHAII